jgi:PhnB protein
MSPVRAIPEGYHSITPALTCKNAAEAIEFYKKAFGAQEIMRMPGPGGKIGHAELKIGDSIFFINDVFTPTAEVSEGLPPMSLFVYVEGVDTVFNRAVAAGAKVAMPLENQFWGDRFGKVTDPYGHQWGLAQHVEDVAPDEMKRRSEAWMKKAAGQS